MYIGNEVLSVLKISLSIKSFLKGFLKACNFLPHLIILHVLNEAEHELNYKNRP